MSNLSVTEYSTVGVDAAVMSVPFGRDPAVTVQNVAFTTTSVQSAAFNADTRLVRVCADVASRVLFDANPTALASASVLLPANTVEYFSVAAGDKVAVITAI